MLVCKDPQLSWEGSTIPQSKVVAFQPDSLGVQTVGQPLPSCVLCPQAMPRPLCASGPPPEIENGHKIPTSRDGVVEAFDEIKRVAHLEQGLALSRCSIDASPCYHPHHLCLISHLTLQVPQGQRSARSLPAGRHQQQGPVALRRWSPQPHCPPLIPCGLHRVGPRLL